MRDRFHSNMMRAAAYGTARAIERTGQVLGWSPVSLEPDRLEADARRLVRFDDFGDPYYREGLNRLVDSIEQDADLHLIGRVYMRRLIHNALVNRLLLQQHRHTRPEVYEAPLRPPIIITGLPRTGSTLLHRMMSRIPGYFGPPYWLLVRPLPGRPGEPEDVRQAAARREVRWWKSITPSVKAKHRVSTNMPEECILALTLTFQTKLFHSMAPVESYLAWYATSDRRKKYVDYRSILLALQATRPGQTLLLKAPDHLGGLDALCAAVPEARIVQLHRDPVAVVNSLASLVYSSQFGLTKRHDPARLAASLAGYLETMLRRNQAQRSQLSVPVLDVHFDRLFADPAGTAAQILAAFDLPLQPRGRAAMARYIAHKSQAERPRHHYSGADFGLDDARTAQRFSFYSACFESAPEERAPVNPTLP
jgi:LPS sulfotransferase NodH